MSCFGSECRAKHEMSSARMSRIADHGLIFVDISIHTSRERVYNTRCGYMLDAESAEEISMSMPLTKGTTPSRHVARFPRLFVSCYKSRDNFGCSKHSRIKKSMKRGDALKLLMMVRAPSWGRAPRRCGVRSSGASRRSSPSSR